MSHLDAPYGELAAAPPQAVDPTRALLINGTVGAGKTSVADAIGGLLAGAGVAHAVIDLDWLRRYWPAPLEDPFHTALTLRNLSALAGNFRAAGARRLVLAGVVETAAERCGFEAAVGGELTLCRLTVDLDVVRQRLVRRHEHDAGLDWHLARCAELDAILDAAAVDDVRVPATGRPIAEVAADVLTAVGWP